MDEFGTLHVIQVIQYCQLVNLQIRGELGDAYLKRNVRGQIGNHGLQFTRVSNFYTAEPCELLLDDKGNDILYPAIILHFIAVIEGVS
jgi:hypothetical protein